MNCAFGGGPTTKKTKDILRFCRRHDLFCSFLFFNYKDISLVNTDINCLTTYLYRNFILPTIIYQFTKHWKTLSQGFLSSVRSSARKNRGHDPKKPREIREGQLIRARGEEERTQRTRGGERRRGLKGLEEERTQRRRGRGDSKEERMRR